MGIKTTPFRRIWLYIVGHMECYNEIGLTERVDLSTVVNKIELNPDDTATIYIIDTRGNKRKLNCKLSD